MLDLKIHESKKRRESWSKSLVARSSKVMQEEVKLKNFKEFNGQKLEKKVLLFSLCVVKRTIETWVAKLE